MKTLMELVEKYGDLREAEGIALTKIAQAKAAGNLAQEEPRLQKELEKAQRGSYQTLNSIRMLICLIR